MPTQLETTRLKLFANVLALYLLTVSFAWYGLAPPTPASPLQASPPIQAMTVSTPAPAPEPTVVSGQPSQIVIEQQSINLPIEVGRYHDDGSWTLSDTKAHFALISAPANDHSGNTFIYGHGTDEVFGRLNAIPPTKDSTALVHTDNGHILSYQFVDKQDVLPSNTSIFDYEGPSMLTLQTCVGPFSELRVFYQYKFEKVVQ